MVREDEIDLKQESDAENNGCPVCLEPFEPETKQLALLLCCTTTSSLKALDSNCAQNIFKQENSNCPCCRKANPPRIALDSASFNKLVGLNEEERKPTLGLLNSKNKIFLDNIQLILAANPQQKDLYLFLCNNNLSSQEYFDNSPLPTKLKKLLDDKVSPDIMSALIEKFISAGININSTDKDGWNALHFICHNWPEKKISPEIILATIDKFLQAGIDVNAANNDGWNVLHLICCYWPEANVSPEIILTVIDKLLAVEINVNAVTKSGWNVLRFICRHLLEANVPSEIMLTVIDKLLAAEINVNAAVNDGWNALRFICRYWPEAKISYETMLTVINKLLEAKINANAADNNGWNALHFICRYWPKAKIPQKNVLTVIEKLLSAGADVNVINKAGETPLQILETASDYYYDSKKLAQSIRLLIVTQFDDSPLPVKMNKLLDDKVSLDVMLAAIEKFIAIGMDVNATDKDNRTALHLVCRNWPTEKISPQIILATIDKFLQAGIDVNAADNDGWNALHFICCCWPEAKVSPEIMLTVINKFLAADINVNAVTKSGWNVLHLICRYWPEAKVSPEIMLTVINKFLAADINVNAVTKSSWNALRFICRYWPEAKVSPEIMLTVIDKFLAAKINVDAADNDGWNALHFICRHWPAAKIPRENSLTVIEKLLLAGADINVTNKAGKTPLQISEDAYASEKLAQSIRLLIIAQTAPPEKKEFYAFLLSKNLTSQEYFDDSPLPVKMRKLLDDKVSPDAMLAAIEKFIAIGMDVNAVDKDGWNALHIVCRSLGYYSSFKKILIVIDKLLATGINVNAAGKKAKTALHSISSTIGPGLRSALPHYDNNAVISVIHKLLEANANTNLINKYGEKALSSDNLILLLKMPTELNIQIASKYLLQQMNANEMESATKVWHWVCEKSSRLQEFKAIVTASEDYHYPLMFARLQRFVTKSFFKDTKGINAAYCRTIELLLVPTNNFVLSEEQLQILEEISTFNKELLSPQLLEGLKLLFANNIIERDGHKAYECFLQAAKAGWLLGHILAAQQCERGLGTAKNLEQAIEHLRETIFSPHAAANTLNKKCFMLALVNLHELANKNKEILALKILGDYYLKLGKFTKAIDFFLQAKSKAETLQQQQLVNEKIISVIFESTLALGQLSYESGAVVKACQEYNYGPAYISMATEYIKRKSEHQLFEAVECYCQAMMTPYKPMAKEALAGIGAIVVTDIQADQKSCFIIIATLIDFIDLNKGKIAALQIPLLMKLIQALKMEKLFLESVSKSEIQGKFEPFAHKFSSKTHFSTNYARAFILLTENKSAEETCQIIVKDENQETILQFYSQILADQGSLPPHLSNVEICQRAKQILQNLEENLSELPALV